MEKNGNVKIWKTGNGKEWKSKKLEKEGQRERAKRMGRLARGWDQK